MKHFYWTLVIITAFFLFLYIFSAASRENYDARYNFHIESSFEHKDLH